jgi:hypothetical protein
MKSDAEIRANVSDESLAACQHQTGVHENSMVRCRGCPPQHKDERSVCAAQSPYCLEIKRDTKRAKRVMTYMLV